MKKILLLTIGVFMVLSFTGCASLTKKVTPEGKVVDLHSDKALVILYSDTMTLMTRPRPLFLMDNEELKGMIAGHKQKTFYYAEPGHRTLALATDNLLMFGGFDFVFFDAELEAGKVYYLTGHTEENLAFSTGAHIYAHAPAMQDIEGGKENRMLPFLLMDELYMIDKDGFQYFEDEKSDLIERYREQLAEWKSLPDSERMKLRASDENPMEVKLHNGKYM